MEQREWWVGGGGGEGRGEEETCLGAFSDPIHLQITGFAIPDCAAFFISSFKVSDAWNVFAPLNSHLIPLLPFISSMSSFVTYEMYSPPFGEIARRLFLENWILLRLPIQLKATP